MTFQAILILLSITTDDGQTARSLLGRNDAELRAKLADWNNRLSTAIGPWYSQLEIFSVQQTGGDILKVKRG